MTIDGAMLSKLREAINAALAPVGGEFKVSIKMGNVSYSPDGTNATAKLNILALVTNSDGSQEVYDEEAETFKALGVFYGFSLDDLGKTVTLLGKEYRITGLKRARRKYPVRLENTRTGKIIVAVAEDVIRGLGRAPRFAFVPPEMG